MLNTIWQSLLGMVTVHYLLETGKVYFHIWMLQREITPVMCDYFHVLIKYETQNINSVLHTKLAIIIGIIYFHKILMNVS